MADRVFLLGTAAITLFDSTLIGQNSGTWSKLLRFWQTWMLRASTDQGDSTGALGSWIHEGSSEIQPKTVAKGGRIFTLENFQVSCCYL